MDAKVILKVSCLISTVPMDPLLINALLLSLHLQLAGNRGKSGLQYDNGRMYM
jgi:hypothetical protein